MKFNLPVKFIIDENKKTVVAKFDTTFWPDGEPDEDNYFDINRYIMEHSSVKISIEMKKFLRLSSPQEFILTSLTGKAKCSKQDKFDLKKGMKIAKTKLMIKFYTKFNKAINSKIKECETITKELYRFGLETHSKIKNAEEKLNRIIDEE